MIAALTACTSCMAISEFAVSGLVPEISGDLHVTVQAAAYLITAFALGMAVGGPAVTLLSRRIPRRHATLLLIIAFVLTQVACATAPGYGVLVVARVATAIVCGSLWGVAASIAMSEVAADRRGRAMAWLTGGLIVAATVGLPLGTLLGQHAGWRSVFWAVAALGALTGAAMFVAVRPKAPAGGSDLRSELRAMRRPAVLRALGLDVLVNAAGGGILAYLVVVLARVSGVATAWIPAFLCLLAAGQVLGQLVGARTRHRYRTICVATAVELALFLLYPVAATTPAAAGAALVVLGLVWASSGVQLNLLSFDAAPEAAALVGTANTAAFNVGGAFGPVLGAAATTIAPGYALVPVLCAIPLVPALAVALVDARASSRPVTSPGRDRLSDPVRRRRRRTA